MSHRSHRLEGGIHVLWIIPQSKSHVCVFIPPWRILWGLNFTSARWASTLVPKRSLRASPSQHCTCMSVEIKVAPIRNFYCIVGPIVTAQHSYFIVCTLFSMAAALTVFVVIVCFWSQSAASVALPCCIEHGSYRFGPHQNAAWTPPCMDAVFHFDDVEKSLLTTSPAVKENTVDELSAIESWILLLYISVECYSLCVRVCVTLMVEKGSTLIFFQSVPQNWLISTTAKQHWRAFLHSSLRRQVEK